MKVKTKCFPVLYVKNFCLFISELFSSVRKTSFIFINSFIKLLYIYRNIFIFLYIYRKRNSLYIVLQWLLESSLFVLIFRS